MEERQADCEPPASPTRALHHAGMRSASVTLVDAGTPGGLDTDQTKNCEILDVRTPVRGIQVQDFTPPPAPFAALRQRRERKDVKLALEKKSLPMLCTIILKDSSVCKCNAGQDHVLHALVENGDPEALAFMLTHGMKDYVNLACGGRYPLHRSVSTIQHEGDPGYLMSKSLLKHKALPDPVSDDGSTPLHEAAANVSLAAVSLLLKHNAEHNRLNALGQSALHLACQQALFVDEELQSKVVDALLAKGADPSLRDMVGFQPIDHATVPMLWSMGSGETKHCQQLRRAIRWQARRQAFLIRCKGDSQDLITKLPDAIFRALVRFV
jgi:hypothetical protein